MTDSFPVPPVGRALLQPHRDRSLSPGHPLLLCLGHFPARQGQGGICLLEDLDRLQLHLALCRSNGEQLGQTSLALNFLVEILDPVRVGDLPQQVQ